MPEVLKEQDAGLVFALDIGTRSIIGMLGRVENGRFQVEAIEKEEHGRRAMLDGQIVEIEQVAQVAGSVIDRLQAKVGVRLSRVCVAAAGRALKSQSAAFTLRFDDLRQADADLIGQLEAGAVSEAEKLLAGENAGQGRFYMVGYTARQYVVDGYPMTNLMDHRGQVFEADVVATFLPSGVVESLYAVTGRLGLEVSSLTLEPIAALNAAIPPDIRLLNLVLVDIGAGTSDIAVCREGSVVGYTMATVAGDEVTELLMRSLLVDFKTGERLKMNMGSVEPLQYPDILGMKHEITSENLKELVKPAAQRLAGEIGEQIMLLNGAAPSAVFLAGGGSKLAGLPQLVAAELDMSEARVALAGNHFGASACSEEYELADPEYATPLGIGASAALGMINDSYMVTLNGLPAKLFRNGALSLRDVLLMNGYHYGDMMGRTGANLSFTLNGQREFFRGTPAVESRMFINGKEAAFSTLVQAGDRIDFTPARSGRAAAQTLAQLLGEDFSGEAVVNGQPQLLSYAIRQGDEVVTEGGETPPRQKRKAYYEPEPLRPVGAERKESLGKKEPAAQEKPAGPPPGQQDLAPEQTREGQTKESKEGASVKEEQPVESQPEKKQGEALAPAKTRGLPKQLEKLLTEQPKEKEAAPRPQPAPQEKKPGPRQQREAEQLSFRPEIPVMLNGEPIRLEPKAQGGDYYLMDLLERSGLDFDHLEGPVELLVNGAQGQFSQVIRPNDQVTIRYKDRS